MQSSVGGQSAIEFITTYSYVFLIIAVAFSILLLYFALPKTIVPLECNYYSGFSCVDASLVIRGVSGGGGSLVIVAQDNQEGIINVSTFNAVLNYKKSSTGYCLPSTVIDGQTIYCIANFTFTPNPSTVYQGSYSLYANYCGGGPSNISTTSCIASDTFVYSGNIRIQPTGNYLITPLNSIINSSPLTFWYVPITLTNNQAEPIPTSTPVMISVNSLLYTTHIKPAWTNVDFTTQPNGRGAAIPAWVESASSNTATNTIVWLSPLTPIPANGNSVIYMNMYNSGNYMSITGPTGEAPQLSSVYGQWDNGANVFTTFYDNFAGTTLGAWWMPFMPSGPGSISVNNGLTLTSSSGGWGGGMITTSNSYTWSPTQYIAEAYVNSFSGVGASAMALTSAAANVAGCEGLGSSSPPTSGYAETWYSWGGPGLEVPQAGNSVRGCYGNPIASITAPSSASTEMGIEWPATGNEISLWGESKVQSQFDANVPSGPFHITLDAQTNSGTMTAKWYWVRVRLAPPGFALPSNSFGNLIRGT